MKETTAVRHQLVLGAGYLGGALAKQALAAEWRVTALTRNGERATQLSQAGCETVTGELSDQTWWNDPALAHGAERVAVTVASGGGGAEAYQRSYVEGLRSVIGWGRRVMAGGGTVGHLIYTSSTAVYPQDGGMRVTEADPIGGEAETTRLLIEAERLAREWPGKATVLRLAGLYGPERTYLVDQVRKGEVAGRAETHLNLIHRDDVLGAMQAVWTRGSMAGGHGESGPEIFNLADEGGATKGEVVAWLAERLGLTSPRFSGQPAGGRRTLTPDRIIDASRARAVLGWQARYRSFREGYSEMLHGSIQA
jgi:nucleoside-diphosphate-sugar epimerase